MMSDNSRSTAHIPYIPGAIERQRLLEKLHPVPSFRLTLISAPPGYGKTILAAQFARKTTEPVAWHLVDERERDLPNLYDHALRALEAFAPNIRTQLPPPQNFSPIELATLIADHLQENLTQDITYVIDDAHHLSGSPAAETWLRILIERFPRNHHLILVSRTIPNLPFADLIAKGEVLAIGPHELRMDRDEVMALSGRMQGTALSARAADRLVERLDGWPAGIMLSLQPLPADFGEAVFSTGSGPEALFETLADSMLRAQPPDLRQFLLAASTLTLITPETCETVLELPNCEDHLALAQTRNLFLSSQAGGMAFHTLFRDFLQQQLRQTDPGAYKRLHIRAGQWYERSDDTELAFTHYVTGGEIGRARNIAENTATAYFGLGRFETLLKWGATLKEEGTTSAMLSYACAMLHTDRYDYDSARQELDAAEEVFAERANTLQLERVRIQRARIHLQRGEYQQAIEQAAPSAQEAASKEVQGRALRVLGLAYLRLGHGDEGIAYLEEALELHRAAGLVAALSHLLQDLQFAYTRLGRLEDAGVCLQEVVSLRRRLGGAGALALALNNMGYYYHQRRDYALAMQTFQDGLNVIAGIPDRQAESALLWSMGDLKRDLGSVEEAQQSYDDALALMPRGADPSLRSSVLVSKATLRRWHGRRDEAILLAEEALKIATGYQIAFEASMAQAALWAAQIGQADADEVLHNLHQVVDDLTRQSASYELTGALTLCALASLNAGQPEEATRCLDAAWQEAQAVGSMQAIIVELVHAPELVALISGEPQLAPLLEGVQQLNDASAELIGGITLNQRTISPSVFTLRVWTLGREEVERDGQLVEPSRWRAAAAREMFFYLLFMGEKTRGEISLEFWPDSSPEQVRANFHTTMHRARHALGTEAIIFKRQHYRINPELETWCDALEMERLVEQARLLPPMDPRAQDLWQRAVALYHGEFLPSVDVLWAETKRFALQERFIEALQGLGQCAYAHQDFNAALDAYGRAVDIEPFREDLHRGVIQCYAGLKDKGQILQQYNKLKKLLWAELGVEPTRETTTLVNSLLG